MSNYFKKVLHIVGKKKKQLPWMLGLYFVAMALELIGISLIIPFIGILQDPEALNKYDIWIQFTNTFAITTNFQAMLYLSGFILGIYVLKMLLNIQTQRAIIRFSYDLQAHLRDRYSRLYLSAPYLFHTKRRSNEIINILQSHVPQFAKAVISALLIITGESLTLMAIGLFLLITQPLPTLTAAGLLLVFGFLYDIFVKRRLKKAGEELITASNDMLKSSRQGIQSLKEARVLGCEDYFQHEIYDSAQRLSNINAYVSVMRMIPRYILETLMVVVVITASLSMLMLGDSGKDVIDSLAIFAVAALRLLPSANQIMTNLSNIRYANKVVEELYGDLEELESFSQSAAASHQKQITDTFRTLSMKNISFTYPDTDEKVLNDINIDFKKGEIIGIVGPSGSGKSTLVDLVLGLIEPQAGQFYLNDNEVPEGSWAGHRLAAYIPQKPVMLDDTVIHNIALGQSGDKVDKDRIQTALSKAQMTEVVAGLSEKENTILGEGAIRFSGGQQQRIALARTFYFNQEIVIFDEATSALDKETELDVLAAIKNLKENAAILIVSHNDQPLEICDRIYHLDDGKIIKETKP